MGSLSIAPHDAELIATILKSYCTNSPNPCTVCVHFSFIHLFTAITSLPVIRNGADRLVGFFLVQESQVPASVFQSTGTLSISQFGNNSCTVTGFPSHLICGSKLTRYNATGKLLDLCKSQDSVISYGLNFSSTAPSTGVGLIEAAILTRNFVSIYFVCPSAFKHTLA